MDILTPAGVDINEGLKGQIQETQDTVKKLQGDLQNVLTLVASKTQTPPPSFAAVMRAELHETKALVSHLYQYNSANI